VLDPSPAVLGLSRDASKAEIKAAFRRLSLEYHPDLNKDQRAESKFVAINRAYTSLTKSHGQGAHSGSAAAASAGSFYRAAKPKSSNGIFASVLVAPLVMFGFYLSKNREQAEESSSGRLLHRPYGFFYPPYNEYLREDLRPKEKARRW
jgi:DnaJ-class molecular chaperone